MADFVSSFACVGGREQPRASGMSSRHRRALRLCYACRWTTFARVPPFTGYRNDSLDLNLRRLRQS
jgi:hypothetical protein